MRALMTVVLLAVQLGCGPSGPDDGPPPLTLKPQPATPSPGPPTSLRLVLQFQRDTGVRLVSATPRRGSIDKPPDPAAIQQDLTEGRVRLVEYTMRDRAGAVMATGTFTLPVTAIAEFQDPDVRTQIRRSEEPLASPTITLSIPYQAATATVTFQSVEPGPEADARTWKRVPLGEITIPAAPVAQEAPRQQ